MGTGWAEDYECNCEKCKRKEIEKPKPEYKVVGYKKLNPIVKNGKSIKVLAPVYEEIK
jgi:hypothetical protein